MFLQIQKPRHFFEHKSAIGNPTIKIKLNQIAENRLNPNYFASVDRLSAVMVDPCSITDTTGVIDSPNASISAAR